MLELQAGTPGRWSHEESVKVNFNQFSQLDHKVDDYTRSPEFSCHGLKWYLQLYPRGKVDDEAERATTDQVDEVKVGMYLCITVQDQEGRAKLSFECPNVCSPLGQTEYIYKKSRGWGWQQFAPRQKILDNCIDDILTVIVKIQVYVPKQRTWTPTQSLQKDVLRLVEEEVSLADVAFLVGADDAQQRIQVNSVILAIRAPFVKELIELTCKDATQNSDNANSERSLPIIPLLDVDPRYFRLLLAFIYSDDTTFLDDKERDLKELVVIANRFGCWKLKLCIEAKFIEDVLNSGTSIDLLVFADAQSCFMLKESALSVVSKLSPLVVHQDFMKLANAPDLVLEIRQATMGNSESVNDTADTVADKYSSMTIVELYEELEKQGINLKSDGYRKMLLEHLRSSKKRKL